MILKNVIFLFKKLWKQKLFLIDLPWQTYLRRNNAKQTLADLKDIEYVYM